MIPSRCSSKPLVSQSCRGKHYCNHHPVQRALRREASKSSKFGLARDKRMSIIKAAYSTMSSISPNSYSSGQFGNQSFVPRQQHLIHLSNLMQETGDFLVSLFNHAHQTIHSLSVSHPQQAESRVYPPQHRRRRSNRQPKQPSPHRATAKEGAYSSKSLRPQNSKPEFQQARVSTRFADLDRGTRRPRFILELLIHIGRRK